MLLCTAHFDSIDFGMDWLYLCIPNGLHDYTDTLVSRYVTLNGGSIGFRLTNGLKNCSTASLWQRGREVMSYSNSLTRWSIFSNSTNRSGGSYLCLGLWLEGSGISDFSLKALGQTSTTHDRLASLPIYHTQSLSHDQLRQSQCYVTPSIPSIAHLKMSGYLCAILH